jgi:hypothetical protein
VDKKILSGIGIGIAIVIIVVAVYGLTTESENGPTPQQIRNEKLGLVINTPTPEITFQSLSDTYSKASSSGIGRSNVYMFWNVIEPEKDQYNWNQYDILMTLNKQNNLKVTLYFSIINGKTLGPFPDWIGKPSLVSISEDSLVKVLDDVLTRYNIVDTLIISGETDAQFRYNENNIPVYEKLFNDVYEKLKQKHPNIKIGNVFSLHGVLNKNLEHIVEELDLGDFVGFTYFPVNSLNEINKNPVEARVDLEKIFEIVPNNNVAIFEISWSTDDFVGGNRTNQQNFMKTTFDFYQENESKLEFVTWYRLYDKPEGTCQVDPESVEAQISIGGNSTLGSSEFVIERLEHYICSAGLLDVDGNPKPAWNEFTKQVQMNTNS